jgi:transglutaminase-like putative cysteine protease
VAEACVWYPRRAFCLQRSWVATLLLRRYGFPAQLVIGYRPIPVDSHAWVEIEGRVVNDRPQYQKFYRVLDRL